LKQQSGKKKMTTPAASKLFEVKSHETPDEVRTPDKTRIEVVRLNGYTMGRLTFQPGWRWSKCIKPVVKTDLCEASHVGYAITGRLTVQLKDGTQKTIHAGESYSIPPGHEAWVEGSEPFVGLEVMSAEKFAKTE
jgi:hypothetical protein